MLMTVLRGELVIKQSRALVRTFKKMKDYIIDNRELIRQRVRSMIGYVDCGEVLKWQR